MRFERWAALVPFLAALALAPSSARAEERFARLEVEREKPARTCPDAPQIAARINTMTGRDAIRDDGDVGVKVRIERARPGYRAVIEVEGARQGVRELVDDTASCSALGEAIAITVALLLDEEVENKPPIRVGREAKAESSPPPPAEPEPPPPPVSRLPSWTLDILVAQSAGLISGGNFAVLAEVSHTLGEHATVGVFGMGVLPERIRLERGRARMNLVFAGVPVCYTLRTDDLALGAGICGFGAVGAMVADGEGLDVDDTATLPWLGLGGALVADGPIVGPLNFSGRVMLLAPIVRPSFQVEDLGGAPPGQVGVVYDVPPVGVAFAYGVRALLP